MSNVAVLYICTGNYEVFWESFYESCETYFVPEDIKSYFVFTDSSNIQNDPFRRIYRIEQDNLGWPFNTLLRFEMFLKVDDHLKDFDYVYFFNANMLFVDSVGREMLAEAGEELVAVIHPGYYGKPISVVPYERNPRSLAFIAEDEGQFYFMGGLNGGTSEAYRKLIKMLAERIRIDLDKGIIAVWHDESHLNRYLIGKSIKVLNPQYGYPEGWTFSFSPKIIIRDKSKWGGHSFLRGERKIRLFDYMKRVIKRVFVQA